MAARPREMLSHAGAVCMQGHNSLDLNPREERLHLFFEAVMRVLDR
jgi:hypothetical protein